MSSDSGSVEKKLASTLQEIVFVPLPAMRQAKAAWLAWLADMPLADSTSAGGPALADVARVVPDPRLKRWWGDPAFRAWFGNRDEFRQRVEYIAHLALDAIEEVLVDRDANANARVRAAQIMLEAASKMPGRGAEAAGGKFLDARVASMGREELQAFVESNVKRLAGGKT